MAPGGGRARCLARWAAALLPLCLALGAPIWRRGRGAAAWALPAARVRQPPRPAALLPRGGQARGGLAGRRAASGAVEWLESQGHKVLSERGTGGSSWSSFREVKADSGEYFVKTSGRPAAAMFEGEARGLRAMGAAGSAGGVKVPEVLHFGDDPRGGSFIIMEKLDMGGRMDMGEFGRAMAKMHLAEPLDKEAKAGSFGFPLDNTIGGTPQKNPWTSDWPEFFREHRIGFQVKRARDSALTGMWNSVLDKTDGLRDLFSDGEVTPSVIHGDLWSGNYAGSNQGPTIFDPATYYGHHEAEWGMAWCAGFNGQFWAGYREVIPKAPLFEKRRALYEAYHLINHYNLFGGGYLYQGIGSLEQLL